MKKSVILYCPIIVLFSCSVYSQDLIGKYWSVSEIIGKDTINTGEYTLIKKDTTKRNYSVGGWNMVFKEDKFSSFYTAECGNDCFPRSIGTFKMIDNDHINLFVEEFEQSGQCEYKKMQLNLDLGNYYISKQSDSIIKLIKSDGNALQDKLNEKYSFVIDEYVKEVGYGSSGLLTFKTKLIENNERVSDFIKTKMNLKNYKILYSKKHPYSFCIINLIKNEDLEDDYFFIINDAGSSYQYQVGYYKLKKEIHIL